jgi:hypothetical protein
MLPSSASKITGENVSPHNTTDARYLDIVISYFHIYSVNMLRAFAEQPLLQSVAVPGLPLLH